MIKSTPPLRTVPLFSVKHPSPTRASSRQSTIEQVVFVNKISEHFCTKTGTKEYLSTTRFRRILSNKFTKILISGFISLITDYLRTKASSSQDFVAEREEVKHSLALGTRQNAATGCPPSFHLSPSGPPSDGSSRLPILVRRYLARTSSV